MKFLYQNLLKPFLFLFSPDLVHKVFVKVGAFIGEQPILNAGLKILYGPPKKKWIKKVDGIVYHGPVLLAAGFDYNGYLSSSLWSMGFAGEEVGSVSAQPCGGNEPPNLTRLIKNQSIQVYKGLRNDGVEKIISRLKKRYCPPGFVQGISIARTNSPDCVEISKGIADYVYSYRRLNESNVGAFYTINISCPNAFGGEDFAKPEFLRQLLIELKKVPSTKPLYFKMPINKPWNEFKELLDILSEFSVNGVVIGNLNKNYQDLKYQNELTSKNYRGGLSGLPCKYLSNELIKKTRECFPLMTIIGCGGIMSVDDVNEKLDLGADLVQMVSGMIFNGPHLPGEINKNLKR